MNRTTKLLLTYLASLLIAVFATYCLNEELEGLAFAKKVLLQYIFIRAAHSVNLRILSDDRDITTPN